MSKERDYYKELAINKFQLEQEWLEQPSKAMYWAEEAAVARTEYNDINLARKILKAELGKASREKLELAGKKPTDKVVEEMIRTDLRYKEITEKLIIAEENMNILEAAKWNFMARKTSLEKIQQGIIIGLFPGLKESNQNVIEEEMRSVMEERNNARKS